MIIDYKVKILTINEKIKAVEGRKESLLELANRFSPPIYGEIYNAIAHLDIAISYLLAEQKKCQEILNEGKYNEKD